MVKKTLPVRQHFGASCMVASTCLVELLIRGCMDGNFWYLVPGTASEYYNERALIVHDFMCLGAVGPYVVGQ